jgi:hypothetical protein
MSGLRGFSPEKRFALKVYQRGDCWEWRGARNPKGYGRFGPAEGENVQAHRFAYDLAKGLIPPGMEIDHICRHRWCVRPSHLELVKHRVNLLRGDTIVAQKAAKTRCTNGHPYDDRNTYRRRDGTRDCRDCNRDRARARRLM